MPRARAAGMTRRVRRSVMTVPVDIMMAKLRTGTICETRRAAKPTAMVRTVQSVGCQSCWRVFWAA